MLLDKIQILSNLKIELENRDFEILKTREKKYIPVKIQKRLIITEIGKLVFKRRIYKYYDSINQKWKYIALLDQEYNFQKWSKIDSNLIAKIEKEISYGTNYNLIAYKFKELVSASTITRIFKKIDYEKIEKTEKIVTKIGQRIYINLDDTFPKVRINGKKTKIKTRVISFNLGIDQEKSSKKRHVLKDKRYFCIIGNKKNTIYTLAQEIKKQGNNFYENFDQAKLVVGGDGAKWIKNIANELDAEYVLDKYHAIKLLNIIFKINHHNPTKNICNWSLYKTCVLLFSFGNYKKLIEILENYTKDQTILNYFKNNIEGIKNFGQPWNIGVSAESDVSKLIKSSFGYGSKLFSMPVFKTIVFSKISQFNRI